MRNCQKSLKNADSLKRKGVCLKLWIFYFVLNQLLQLIPNWLLMVMMSNIGLIIMPFAALATVFMAVFLAVKIYHVTTKIIVPIIVFLMINVFNYYLAFWMTHLVLSLEFAKADDIEGMLAGIAIVIYYLVALILSSVAFMASIIITKIVNVRRIKKQQLFEQGGESKQ